MLPATRQMVLQRFNSQPPEGGWHGNRRRFHPARWFQLTAARRRLAYAAVRLLAREHDVSTHSRPKAAGPWPPCWRPRWHVSTHSRPKAAGDDDHYIKNREKVSTHSRPKAAGCSKTAAASALRRVSTHSRPKAAGHLRVALRLPAKFQLTAARRRLGKPAIRTINSARRFNSQPPEGGW